MESVMPASLDSQGGRAVLESIAVHDQIERGIDTLGKADHVRRCFGVPVFPTALAQLLGEVEQFTIERRQYLFSLQ